MAAQSIAPVFTFTFLEPTTVWPSPETPAKKVLGEATGENDPLKKITSFSCNLGLGDQTSTLSIELSGFHLNAQKNVGRVVIFKCDEFGFGGMIKSIVHTENKSGQQTKIDIVDMKEAFARYDLFINEWHDTTDKVSKTSFRSGGSSQFTIRTGWNCKNIHRVIEKDSWGDYIVSNYGQKTINDSNYGKTLPDIGNCVVFGTHTDGKVSQGTTTYSKILQALVDDPALWYNTNSYPLYVGLGTLRDIAKNEIPYVGTNAKTMTLLELVNNVCEEAGYDWTFHTPVGNGIQIRFVNKKTPTTFGEIKNRIETAKNDNKLLNYSIGAEFKNEKTRRVVIGSRVNYIKEMYFANAAQRAGQENNNREHSSAYVLGFNSNNFPVLGYSSGFNVPINVRTLQVALSTAGFGGFYEDHMMYEGELLATGTLATWKLYGILNSNSLSRSCMNALGIDWRTAYSKVSSSFGGDTHSVSQACVEAVKFTTRKNAGDLLYEELCYPWIKNFYDTYYGKYYMCLLPKQTCFFDLTGFMQNTGIFLGPGSSGFMSDEPTDSGWEDSNITALIGLNNWDLFRDGSGKSTCFCGIRIGDSMSRFMGPYNRSFRFDPSSLQGDYIRGGPNHIYTKAEVDGRCYNINGQLGILIKMPNMIPYRFLGPQSANSMGLRMLELLVGNANGFSRFGGTTDYSYTNVFKETLSAGRFDRIAIPMKSNVVNYGPWLSNDRSTAWDDGGVELKVVEDLNPWSYGGYAGMNTAGQRLAVDGLKKRNKYESGSITIAETPKKNMEAGGSSGIDPMINSIVCKLDAGGATTTYNYQTYVQKFGQSAEALNNYTKLNISARRANFNILKDMNLQIIRAFSEGMRTFGSIRDKLFEQDSVPLSVSSSSLNNILILSYPDGGYPGRIEAGIDKKYTSDYFQDYRNYEKYAIVSLDMIFSPVVTSPFVTSPYMPSIKAAEGNVNNYPLNATKSRIPPIGSEEIKPILNIHLNPYTTSATMGNFGSVGNGRGFFTEYISFGSVPANTLAVNSQQANFRDNQTSFRSAALRGPLLLHAWGYDINGKPVPGNGKTFNSNWLANPTTWPCGPIDLRWDKARGVWVSPPSASLVIGTLKEDLFPGGSARASVSNVPGFYNENIAGGEITVYDWIGEGIPEGTHIIAYHFGAEADYIVLNHGDKFVKGNAKGCADSNGVGQEIQQQDGYLQGFGPQGRPALYSIAELLGQNLSTPGGTQVLGYDRVNGWGAPCMVSIPIVDCTGQYPGDDNPLDPACPPGYTLFEGECLRNI